MAAGRFVVPPYFPARNRNDTLLGGALLYVYQNLTPDLTSVYADEGLTTPLVNPVVANASGSFPAIWAEAGTEADPVLYSLSVTTATGEAPGNPFTFDNYRPSVDFETATLALAEAAADEADTARDQAVIAADLSVQAYEDILALAAAAPDTDPVVIAGKANVTGSNILGANQAAFRTAIGAIAASTLAASGGSALIGYNDGGTDAVDTTVTAFLRNRALDVLQYCSAAERAAVIAGTSTTNLLASVNKAIAAAVASNRPILFRGGQWSWDELEINDDLTILTDGFETVFKQVSAATADKVFKIKANVSMWEGGAATIVGNIATDAGEFNHGISVWGRDGAVIERFACGDVRGVNIRGDVICTEVRPGEGGSLAYCKMGTIYGDNIYRNIVSIAGGDYGHITSIVAEGGVGIYALDIEPDPSTAPNKQWWVGNVVGNRIGLVGDPSVVSIGSVRIETAYLDLTAYPTSTPAYSLSATMTGRSVIYRNAESISFGTLYIANCTYEAIADLGGEVGTDQITQLFHIGSLKLINCGATPLTAIQVRRTQRFVIDDVTDVAKPASNVATFTGFTYASDISVGGGKITGKICDASPGNVTISGLLGDTNGNAAVRNVVGRVTFVDTTMIGVYAVQNAVILPVCVNCTFTLAAVSNNGVSNALMIGSSNNGVYRRADLEVQSATQTGWTTGTGTASKGAFAAYAGQTVSAAYVQAEAQATDNAARNASQRLLALEAAMRAFAIIN